MVQPFDRLGNIGKNSTFIEEYIVNLHNMFNVINLRIGILFHPEMMCLGFKTDKNANVKLWVNGKTGNGNNLWHCKFEGVNTVYHDA